MSEERKILVLTAHEAERGLIDNIYKTLDNDDRLLPVLCKTPDYKKLTDRTEEWSFYADVMSVVSNTLDSDNFDIILVPTDRYEMVLSALVAFRKNVPIAHFHAGDIGYGTYDDVYRHLISMMSSLLFVQGEYEAENLEFLGIEPHRIHKIGSVAFDNIELDDSTIPVHPYVLVLWHPVPHSEEQTQKEVESLVTRLRQILDQFSNTHIYWLPPNKEENQVEVLVEQTGLSSLSERVHIIDRLPRNEFLGWLKNATLFVSNSSCTLYEAPYLDTLVLNFSVRNQNRYQPEIITGGTVPLADALADFDLNDTLIKLGYAQKLAAIRKAESLELKPTVDTITPKPKDIPVEPTPEGWWLSPNGKYHYIRTGAAICNRVQSYDPTDAPPLLSPDYKLPKSDKCAFCTRRLKKNPA